MTRESNHGVRASFKPLFFLILGLCVLILLWVKWWPRPSSQKPEWAVPVDGLIRGEVYFYGPSDREKRERYGGSDEERTLVLLDGRPAEEELPPEPRFQGGNLYRMAKFFGNNYILHEIHALPEDSYTVFQYNFYYEDGRFFLVNVYPHAISINGSLYQIEGDGEGDVTVAEFLEVMFWQFSARVRSGEERGTIGVYPK